MKKKLIGIFLSIAMVSVLITGCGGSDTGAKQEETAQEETADTDADETDSAEEEDVEDEADSAKSSTEGGQLVIPVSATVTNLNPLLESMAEGAFQLSPFADELYYVDQEETRYYLAESCEVSEDGLTYTLKLKDNLKWHDGEPITADDVIFTADCNADTNNGAGYTNTVFVGEEPVKYEKVDDLTVNFTVPQPSASYLEVLGKLQLIPAHAFDGSTDIVSAEANLTDIGSGPYRLSAFNDGESLVLEKFEDYYGDAPQIDSIVFQVISDPSAQEVAFKNGEINYLLASSDATVEEFKSVDGAQLHQLGEGRVKYLAWNKYSDTWKDRDAVKALFAALDQNEIVEGAYGASMGIPANTIFSNQNLFHDEELTGYEQDLDTAKELAEKSGLSGKTIKLHYNTDRSYMEETALLIQQQLKAIDVNVEIEGIDANGFFDVVFTDQADYELYLNEYAAIGDPDSVVAGMYDGTWGINVDTSDEILDLFKQGRETTDMEERAEIYKELQQKAIDEYLVYPIAYPNYCFVTSDNLQGAEYYETTPVFEDYTKLYFE
ncbi:MAG: ABC transporter substrate-binding protein [Lachnospiraceae bacterium]|nr:ABC transporter substrate-binding protein [Lachnospiraceae bacterium]